MKFNSPEEQYEYLKSVEHYIRRERADEYRMRSRKIQIINEALHKTRKAVISIGCSFTEGEAAYDQEILDVLRPMGGSYSNFDYNCKGHDIQELMDFAQQFDLHFQIMDEGRVSQWNKSENNISVNSRPLEINNAFVNKFCEHLDAGYVPINAGHAGNGNMAAVNRLFTYPIDWDICDEIIVLWCYSDEHRFDISKDTNIDHSEMGHDHDTMWPKHEAYDPDIEKFHQGADWHNAQYYLTQTAWSDAFAHMNFVTCGSKVDTWCKAYGAKLLTFAAFHPVDKQTMENEFCMNKIFRDSNRHREDREFSPFSIEYIQHNYKALSRFPWDSMCEPGGKTSFFQYVYSQEETYNPNLDMYKLIHDHGGTPNDWIFPCGHPSAKGHDLLAKWLIKESQDRGFIK